MRGELLINVTPQETRVAVIENGMLQELHTERTRARGLVGQIYMGRVVRVLPGMQAAFVDIGLERSAFIHEKNLRGDASAPITSRIHEGQALRVQIEKDPIGDKGARLTAQISLPARYLVFMPDSDHLGVSARITDEDERERLKALVLQEAPDMGGFVIRTAAEGVSEAEILADLAYLKRKWADIQAATSKSGTVPRCLHQELPLALRACRDLIQQDTEVVRIDSAETFAAAQQFCRIAEPEVLDKLQWYPGERPLFDLYSVEEEIRRALARRVDLKSGGYLVLDQTEAMTTIDVNTGTFVGQRNLEETIFKTNLEAAAAIGRQLRLRALAGIIIVDFIDMKDSEHQNAVLRTLEATLRKDPMKHRVSGISELGLVEISRKRVRESLGGQLCEPCITCEGRGRIRTAETVAYDLFRDVLRESRAYLETNAMLVLAHPRVVEFILEYEADQLADLEAFTRRSIRLQEAPEFTPEHYDVVPC